jgi:hypothetical protein
MSPLLSTCSLTVRFLKANGHHVTTRHVHRTQEGQSAKRYIIYFVDFTQRRTFFTLGTRIHNRPPLYSPRCQRYLSSLKVPSPGANTRGRSRPRRRSVMRFIQDGALRFDGWNERTKPGSFGCSVSPEVLSDINDQYGHLVRNGVRT